MPFSEFSVNSSMAESTEFTPIGIIYGCTSASPVDHPPGLLKILTPQEFIFKMLQTPWNWQNHELPRPRGAETL